MATPLFDSDEVPVEMEYEGTAVSQYPVAEAEVTPNGVLFVLGTKHTDCLAKDKCGVPSVNADGCAAPGCC